MYESILKGYKFDSINLSQFISKGKGVCFHFAGFTYRLLNSLGVDCKQLDSLGDEQTISGHSFNVVNIDGKSYFLDNTWLSYEIQNGSVFSLAESNNFLESNDKFGHENYKDIIDEYNCDEYDREEIFNSINKVVNWNNNYIIHLHSLRDLFRKHILRKEKCVAKKIEDAIPRR